MRPLLTIMLALSLPFSQSRPLSPWRPLFLTLLLSLTLPIAGTTSPSYAEDRLVGLSISELAHIPYDASLNEARSVGVGYVTLPLVWDDLETSPGIYAPDPDWLAIATSYYPLVNLPFALEINPIDTIADRRPRWLQNAAWDSPEVIDAYLGLLEYALDQSANSKLVSITIGNEVDVFLGDDVDAWRAYSRFLDIMTKRVHVLRPGLSVGVKTTFGALNSAPPDALSFLHAQTDIVQLTYYGLDQFFAQGIFAAAPISEIVAVDIEKMTYAFPHKEIHLAEIGFPSGENCFRGEVGQAEFINAFFKAWDNHPEQISSVMWEWMYDIPPAQVASWADYYGIHDACFSDYLATLGLKNSDGSAKLGWEAFTKEVSQRFN